VTAPAQEQSLRDAADLFHKIVSGVASARLIAAEGHKMPQGMYDSIAAAVLTNEAIEQIAADGFELCVRALAAMGAKDVSIHECGKKDMEIF
jgi:hypothetical protein